MPVYAFFQCANPSCALRFPLDTQSHQGEFCPMCGGKLERVQSNDDLTEPRHDCEVPNRSIRVVLDNIRSALNVGAIFRTSDGVGVEHLYLCGITPTPTTHPALTKTALGSEKMIPWSSHLNALDLAEKLKVKGFFLLALERTSESVPIQDFSLDQVGGQTVALIIGHERAGVDPGLLAFSDARVALPMAGQKASLNVAVAFGVAVYRLAFH